MLAMTFVVLGIAVLILAFAGATLVTSFNRNVYSFANLKQAHYVAEKGIEETIPKVTMKIYQILQGLTFLENRSEIELDNGKRGEYQVTVKKGSGNTIEFRSKGTVKSQNDKVLAEKTVVCTFGVKENSLLDLFLENAISTSQNLNAGKVYIYIDKDQDGNPVASSANVYSDADITNIGGVIPGSVIAQGKVTANNNTKVLGDVIANQSIMLNNNTEVSGKVISASSYVYASNRVKVNNDIVAYGVDSHGDSVSLANQSGVNDIYTQEGESQVNIGNSVTYGEIGTIAESSYPATYVVPRQSLPQITEETQNLWISQAQSDDLIYEGGLEVSGNFQIAGNAYIDGNLIINNNANLQIKEGSLIYVTGYLKIENNASVSVIDADGDSQVIFGASLVTAQYFDIRNNAIPHLLSLVALGSSTSYLKNNSVTTGAIFVPNGNLEINNNAIVHGGIFAKSIPTIGNNAQIYFNPFKNLSLPPTFTDLSEILDLKEWEEKGA